QLNPGGSMTGSQQFTLRPEAAGQYVIVQANSFQDQFPSNNAASAPTNVTPLPRANLHVSKVQTQAGSPSGEQITVPYTVTNDGATMWKGDNFWYDQIYVTPDPVFYYNRALASGFVSHSNVLLGAGQSIDATATVTLAQGMASQKYYVYVVT